jgi:esterase/lipase superfamily enzyme
MALASTVSKNNGNGTEKNVQIYFATTRLNKGSDKSPVYGGERHLDFGNGGSVEYGTVGIHKPDNLVHPSSASNGKQYKKLLRSNADDWRKSSFTFVSKTDEDTFFKRIHDWTGHICIYLHGYDKPFEEAVADSCMLFADYQQYENQPQKKMLPILFSWPSIGGRTEYGTDEANLEWSATYFDKFMDRILQEKNPNAQLDVVGHSMGVRLLLWYLNRGCHTREQPLFHDLYLCSGDVDFHTLEDKRSLFEESVSNKVYIFVSDRDKALILSHLIHQQPRMGRPIDSPKFTRQRNQIFSSAYLNQLTTDTSDLLTFNGFTEPNLVKEWLEQNPKLDREFGDKSRLIDVSDLVTKDFGHGPAFSVIASYMVGQTNIPQLKEQLVHKRPDRTTLLQNNGKPPFLYRFHRLEPLNSY